MATNQQTIVTGPTTVRPANRDALQERRRRAARGRHPAQLYCLLAGLSLLLAGALGFIVDASFDVGSGVDGDELIVFEVNGIHNIVHILTGLLVLGAAALPGPARAVAVAFGLTYGLVALIGLIDGDDVLGLIPVNAADNALHVALSLLGIVAGLLPWPNRERKEVPHY